MINPATVSVQKTDTFCLMLGMKLRSPRNLCRDGRNWNSGLLDADAFAVCPGLIDALEAHSSAMYSADAVVSTIFPPSRMSTYCPELCVS